jgi:hypothetical protein
VSEGDLSHFSGTGTGEPLTTGDGNDVQATAAAPVEEETKKKILEALEFLHTQQAAGAVRGFDPEVIQVAVHTVAPKAAPKSLQEKLTLSVQDQYSEAKRKLDSAYSRWQQAYNRAKSTTNEYVQAQRHLAEVKSFLDECQEEQDEHKEALDEASQAFQDAQKLLKGQGKTEDTGSSTSSGAEDPGRPKRRAKSRTKRRAGLKSEPSSSEVWLAFKSSLETAIDSGNDGAAADLMQQFHTQLKEHKQQPIQEPRGKARRAVSPSASPAPPVYGPCLDASLDEVLEQPEPLDYEGQDVQDFGDYQEGELDEARQQATAEASFERKQVEDQWNTLQVEIEATEAKADRTELLADDEAAGFAAVRNRMAVQATPYS